MKKLFYKICTKEAIISCFKLTDRDESKEPGYEVECKNVETGDSDSVEAYTPQSCIALAYEVMKGLES